MCIRDSVFNLEDVEPTNQEEILEQYDIETTDTNTFLMHLPRSKYLYEFKLLTGQDEKDLVGKGRDNRSLKLLEAITVSINNQTDRFYIKRALSSLPIMDASIIKRIYGLAMPDVDLTQEVECTACGENFSMEVPLDANFFWPDVGVHGAGF